MTEKWLWFDLDGSIVDFYGVDHWLDDIRAFNPRPYRVAKPLYNMYTLCAILYGLRREGWHIGVISWLSKEPEVQFDMEVIRAKNDWLKAYGMADLCDEIVICSHGLRKAEICRQFCRNGILVDDEEKNRQDWDLGLTIDARENVLGALLKLL